MENEKYWIDRANYLMYHRMEDAEQAADEIAMLYQKASKWLIYEAGKIFDKYQNKHGLTEQEARRLMSQMQNSFSIRELRILLEQENKSKEILAQLDTPAYQFRIDRLQQIQNQLDIVMNNVYRQEKAFAGDFFVDFANECYYRQLYEIQHNTSYAFSFAHIDKKQIDKVVSMPWSGKHYSERLWRNQKTLTKAIKEELLIDLVTGRPENEAAKIIANKFNQRVYESRRLIRTESAFVAGELNALAYEECDLKQYKYLATLDLRTSKICRELDGKIFFLKDRQVGKNYPPMHPWCRSTTIAFFSKDELKNLKRRAYNHETGKCELVPASMTYNDWYKKYVKGKQKAETQEKAIKNKSSDKEQYKRYQEVLGKDAPKSFTNFQELKYNNLDKWEFVKLDYKRRNELLEHPELKLPNVESAILPEPKFTKYLFDENSKKGYPKGKAFISRLGYSIDNWQELQSALKQGAMQYPARYVENNGYGDKYMQKMVLYGLKDTPANVIVGWLKKPDGTMNLTSAYIKEVK